LLAAAPCDTVFSVAAQVAPGSLRGAGVRTVFRTCDLRVAG